MIKKSNVDKGKEAEDLAAEFLIRKGYDILEMNWRYRKAELDIIATDQTQIVFVEVKSRAYDAYGAPELGVTPKKLKMLTAGASAYLRINEFDKDFRFDIISLILRNKEDFEIEHYEDAFFPF